LSDIKQDFTFEAMLVYWRSSLTLTRFINPEECSAYVTSLSCEEGESEESVDVIGVRGTDLFVDNVCLTVLMSMLVPIAHVEQDCQL